ncbi:UDP-N-acetylglucosamine 2-epimerase [Pelotomaculum propionicicum]|uniref:UDP-N-acetylglucosamine 2-epimerase n=1 Tax=Pelotomaculum propionicicum TaxID=258475 RepID=UPI003B77395A
MKNKISILTATRAEYGLLKPIIQKLIEVPEFDVRVVVTGAHLSSEFGLTYKEIELDDIAIDEKIEILLSADTPSAISKSMGLAMISFADYFDRIKPDMLIVLGDRYETLAVCIVAMNQRIPIAHLYGGESSEGLIDECIRHSITKMSYLHFTSTEKYRKRVIQLGEDPSRVFDVGAIGVENTKKLRLLEKLELAKSIDFEINKPYAVVTFHPVTLEKESSREQMIQLLEAIDSHKELNYIFTKANSDTDGRIINYCIEQYVSSNSNCIAVTSLGVNRYLSAIKYCAFAIGNSSSGIIEVPSFKKPTINIGDRQKGRIQAKSIINCKPDSEQIKKAMDVAMSDDFRKQLKNVVNPYERPDTSNRIVAEIREWVLSSKLEIKKKFYDVEVNH